MWVTLSEETIQRAKEISAKYPITYKGEVVELKENEPPQGFDPDFWAHLVRGDHLREPFWVSDPSDPISDVEV